MTTRVPVNSFKIFIIGLQIHLLGRGVFSFFSITQQNKKRSKEENRVRYTLNQRISKLVVGFDRYE